jgi:hypothetical protein
LDQRMIQAKSDSSEKPVNTSRASVARKVVDQSRG